MPFVVKMTAFLTIGACGFHSIFTLFYLINRMNGLFYIVK